MWQADEEANYWAFWVGTSTEPLPLEASFKVISDGYGTLSGEGRGREAEEARKHVQDSDLPSVKLLIAYLEQSVGLAPGW